MALLLRATVDLVLNKSPARTASLDKDDPADEIGNRPWNQEEEEEDRQTKGGR